MSIQMVDLELDDNGELVEVIKESVTEINTPNDSWKGSKLVEVADSTGAPEMTRKFIAHLIATTQNIINTSVRIKKMTKMAQPVKL